MTSVGHYSKDQIKHSSIDIEQWVKDQITNDIDTMVYSDVRYSLNEIEGIVRSMIQFIDPLNKSSAIEQIHKCLDALHEAQMNTRTKQNEKELSEQPTEAN